MYFLRMQILSKSKTGFGVRRFDALLILNLIFEESVCSHCVINRSSGNTGYLTFGLNMLASLFMQRLCLRHLYRGTHNS